MRRRKSTYSRFSPSVAADASGCSACHLSMLLCMSSRRCSSWALRGPNCLVSRWRPVQKALSVPSSRPTQMLLIAAASAGSARKALAAAGAVGASGAGALRGARDMPGALSWYWCGRSWVT
ncbi:unnamed protein product [Prorocentrum cordatum]|uniref:Uncharacterized protein n=1 Tax=Prorocentrum cordatum TaxID=2364126 RepID=A0ABN9TR01_9DINO|nr:unnamed protein product [Polarella glacialis]